MKRLLWCITVTFMVSGLYAGTITIPGDKATSDQLTAAEWNTWKNRVGGVINGNIDTANIKTDGVGTTELVNDAVTPAKLDEDNTTVFTMKGLVVTDGVTASTMTTTSTGTFAVANITTIENSPTFTYGFTAATATITQATISSGTITSLSYTYVDAQTRYYSIPSGDFVPETHTSEWQILQDRIKSNHTGGTDAVVVAAGVHLPHGAVVISFKAFWFRDDASASGDISLYRYPITGTLVTMATANSDSSGGNHTVEDTSIINPTIDNSAFMYTINATIDPNDSTNDVHLYGCIIAYTITTPLP